MAQGDMSEGLCITLLKKGYTVKSLEKSCFDLVARKGSTILLLKVLKDANAISDEHANQMLNLSRYIGASPLIVAEKAGSDLKDNVVYSRLGIYTLNISTFKSCIDGKLPFISSTNAGLAASIISEKVRQKREELGISLAELSKKIGVSRRMVSKYEIEKGGIAQLTLSKAERVYNILGHDVFDKIDIFGRKYSAVQDKQTPITKKYSELGFEASGARKVPFDVIARKNDELILTEVGDRTNPSTSLLSKLLDADSLVIFNKKKPKDKDVPSLARQEFMEFSEADELIRFVRGF